MDREGFLFELSKHYDDKIQRKQTLSARRPISHIDAFYARGSSNGLIDRQASFVDAEKVNESALNLNSLIQRAQAEQDQSSEDCVEYICHRKTKIICSLGQQTNNFQAILELLKKGMNICRINTAQIQNKEHKILIEMVRRAAKISRKKCGIYIDLQGPRIRLGDFKDRKPSVKIKAGQKYLLYCKKKVIGDESFIGVENSELAKHIKVGDHVIIDHGKAFLKVTGFKDEDEFLAEQAEKGDLPQNSRVAKIISHRGTMTTIGDSKKTKYEQRQRQLNDLSTKVFLNSDPDMTDSTGIQNYVRLCHARPVESMNHQIMDGSAFTHIAIDASLFESNRTIGWSEAKDYEAECDDRLIKQIIAKGRFSNQIAKALHDEKKLDKQFSLTTVDGTINSQTATKKLGQLGSSGGLFGKLGGCGGSGGGSQTDVLMQSTLQTISEETTQQMQLNQNTPRTPVNAEEEMKLQNQWSVTAARGDSGKIPELSKTESSFFDTNNTGVSQTLQTAAKAGDDDKKSKPSQEVVTGQKHLEEVKVPSPSPTGSTPTMPSRDTPVAQEVATTPKEPSAPVTPRPAPAAKPAAKLAPAAAGGRRRRVVKKPEEKKKVPKVIECVAELDGEIMAGKSIYLPEMDLKEQLDLPVVDQQDLILINSLIKLGVDFVSVGGIENKADLNEVKELLSVKGRHIKLLAKLQSRKALANFDELLEEADGIVIARGQLGLEFQIEDIAFIQEYIIKKCNKVKKPVILSTEIMESMITRLRPTRSEVADISKAISNGIDCLILTGETSFGPNWRETTDYMSKICYEAEQNQNYEVKYNIKQSVLLEKDETLSIEESMSNNAVSASYMLGARLIILFSNTGEQAITVAKFSPQCPVLAVLSSESFSKNVLLHSGIFYMTVGSQLGRESLIGTVKKEAIDMKLVKKGDVVIILTGMKEGLVSGNNWIQTDVI